VPLVIPEVNADHLHLIEEQALAQSSGGYGSPKALPILHPPSAWSWALKPIEERFGIERSLFPMQAVSGAGLPVVASDGTSRSTVVPFIGGEKKKMEAETLKLLAISTARGSRR